MPPPQPTPPCIRFRQGGKQKTGNVSSLWGWPFLPWACTYFQSKRKELISIIGPTVSHPCTKPFPQRTGKSEAIGQQWSPARGAKCKNDCYSFVQKIFYYSSNMDCHLSEEKHYSDDTSSPSPQKMAAFAGSYLLIRKIQIGGQASIFLAQRDESYFAIKVYSHSEASLKAFQNEVAILDRLDCGGLVPIEETANHVPLKLEGEPETVAHIIVMPFMENGDVFEWVGKRGCLTEGVTRYFSKKLVGTLRYLNSRHILHRDIKPENILLDEHFEPLLLDFGLSMDARLKVHSFVGDIRFAAPEVVKHIEHTEKSEIYSLGILMFYLQTGQHPFAHARVSDPNYRLLVERKPHLFWQKIEARIKIKLSASFKQLFLKMVDPRAENRPSFDQLMEFQWFSEDQPSSCQYQRSFQSGDYPSAAGGAL